MTTTQTHYRTCNICEAMCGLEIQYEGSTIRSIRGNKNDVFSRGHICPKAVALQDFYHDPDRLKQPVKKIDGQWHTISWEEAISEVAERLLEIQQQYGNNAVGTYLGNPNAHKVGNSLFMPFLLKALQTHNRFSASSVDQLPHHFAANYMFGHGSLLPVPDIDHTDFMMIIGGNPIISNGSMMTCPDFANRMKAVQKRGGKIVVVDPRRTETAHKADEHLFIRPGTDAFLLMAIIHVLYETNSIVPGHLQPLIDGIEKMQSWAQSFAPENVQKITGISASHIRKIVQQLCAAKSGVVYSRMGASTQAYGGACIWLTNVINILTGNLDKRGGAMFAQPAYDLVMLTPKKGKPRGYGRYASRVKGLPYYNAEFPVSTMATEILTPGDGQIQAMITVAGNPILSCPNGTQMKEAFESLQFYVAIDPYINETTRHADYILPGTVALEESQYDIAFHNLAVRNVVKYAPPLFAKQENQKHDWEIIRALTARLKGTEEVPLTPEILLEMGWQASGHGDISISRLLEQPEGIDLGPLQPCLTHRLQTDSGMIHLAPDIMHADIQRMQTALTAVQTTDDTFPLLLIGRRLLRSHNTWCHNSHRLIKGRNECTLLIHPQDAARYHISLEQPIEIASRVGRITIQGELSDDMMPGVVSMPHGWGHTDPEALLSVAQTQPGVSINLLTDQEVIDPLTGNAVLNGVPVRIGNLSQRK